MNRIEKKLLTTLERFLTETAARSLVSLSVTTADMNIDAMEPGDNLRLLRELENLVRLCIKNPAEQKHCVHALSDILRPLKGKTMPTHTPAEVPIVTESDVVTARSLGRDMGKKVGFSPADQIKLATAVSELARNIVQYGGRGKIVISILNGAKPGLEVHARDDGPAADHVDFVFSEQFRSKIGMGRGLTKTQSLVDDLDIKTTGSNVTEVTARKYLC